jgi:hypothetical protein
MKLLVNIKLERFRLNENPLALCFSEQFYGAVIPPKAILL